jgi:hypothetical protein
LVSVTLSYADVLKRKDTKMGVIQSHGYGGKKEIADSEKLQATLPPSCAYCHEILGTTTFWSPKGLSRPVMGWL